jgi:hypothetical protein
MHKSRGLRRHYAQQTKQKVVEAMTDNQTLLDHRARVVSERNELLLQVAEIQARIDELTKQLAGLWKVES